MVKRFAGFSLLALAAYGYSQSDAPTLKVGDNAPPVKVAKWVKGKPTKLGNGKVNVVEFWATWCGPCKQSIPHLSELAKKYQGKATFTGVSVWEKNAPKGDYSNYGDKVAAFVKEWDKKMEYNVAWDGEEATMASTWMTAAGQNGIPTAFVIDQKGKIAWIGHPMANLDEVVGQVIDGKFDTKAEAERAAKERAEMSKSMESTKAFRAAMKAKDYKQAVDELDKLIATHPDLEAQYASTKFTLLLKTDEAAGYAYGKKLSEGLYKDEPTGLNSIAWTIVDDKTGLKTPDYALAVLVAQRASELTKDENPFILDTYALAQFKSGNVDKAIALQEKAIGLAEKPANQVDAATLKEMRDRLEMFKKKKIG